MSNYLLFRRQFLDKAFRVSTGVMGVNFLLSNCQQSTKGENKSTTAYKGDPCANTQSVSEAELTKRKSLGYVSESPIANNQCSNCNLYLPPKEGQSCGGCMLFKGPVHAAGYCTYWAVKV